jgi:peptidoglycan/LPS O-acetylase OafA/YrhL
VAAGNSFLGLLESAASQTLGEMAYSIYLLHGIVLYTTFEGVVGSAGSKRLSVFGHWAVVAAVIPALLILSCLAFCFIERPAMEKTTAAEQWLRLKASAWTRFVNV